jgi:hypothetical protein
VSAAAPAHPATNATSTAQRKRRGPRTTTAPTAEPSRLVVKVPERIHRQLKARAASEGKTMAEYLLEILAEKGIR